MKISQMNMMLESKDKAYSELLIEIKELQYQNDKLKMSSESNFIGSSYDLKTSNAYESPFRNFLPSSFNYKFTNPTDSQKPISDIVKTSVETKKATNEEIIPPSKSINPSEFSFKSKSIAEKYCSDSVSAALFWDKSSSKPAISTSPPTSALLSSQDSQSLGQKQSRAII